MIMMIIINYTGTEFSKLQRVPIYPHLSSIFDYYELGIIQKPSSCVGLLSIQKNCSSYLICLHVGNISTFTFTNID